jgi:hypothetical protein
MFGWLYWVALIGILGLTALALRDWFRGNPVMPHLIRMAGIAVVYMLLVMIGVWLDG